MKDLVLPVREIREKMMAAKTHFLYLDELRTAPLPAYGSSFLIGKSLYVFVEDDGTPDDRVSSIEPIGMPLGMVRARYRRVTPSIFPGR